MCAIVPHVPVLYRFKMNKLQMLKSTIFNAFKGSLALNYFITALILLNFIAVFAATFPIPADLERWLYRFEVFSIGVFTFEYFTRVWVSHLKWPQMPPYKARIRYLFTPLALVDLLSIVPFYLPFFFNFDLRTIRILRLFRLIQLFKLNRYTDAFSKLRSIFAQKSALFFSSLSLLTVLGTIASVFMYYAEHDAQPHVFQNGFSGLWWAVATFTTVGYGDIYPVTSMGKLISSFISVIGIGIIAIPTGLIASGFIEVHHEAKEANRDFFLHMTHLKALRDQGALTEEEYLTLKAKLIEGFEATL